MAKTKEFTVEELLAELEKQTSINKVLRTKIKPEHWAVSSRFYGQIMKDGNIFNPYLHRRFLPVQYLGIMARHNGAVDAAFRTEYAYQYAIDWLCKEVSKLAFLEKVDKKTFEERSIFLSKETVKAILQEYVTQVKTYITEKTVFDSENNGTVMLKGKRGRCKVGKKTFRVLKDGVTIEENIIYCQKMQSIFADLDRLVDFIPTDISYSALNSLLSSFKWIVLPSNTQKPSAWIEAFKQQGAFYTFKHLVLFEKCTFNGLIGNEAIDFYIDQMENFTKQSYVGHAMVKGCIIESGFQMPRSR